MFTTFFHIWICVAFIWLLKSHYIAPSNVYIYLLLGTLSILISLFDTFYGFLFVVVIVTQTYIHINLSMDYRFLSFVEIMSTRKWSFTSFFALSLHEITSHNDLNVSLLTCYLLWCLINDRKIHIYIYMNLDIRIFINDFRFKHEWIPYKRKVALLLCFFFAAAC